MSIANKSRVSSARRALKAELATHLLLHRCASKDTWLAHELAPDGPAARAIASEWTHDASTPITWEACTPLTTYSVLLLLDDARLSLHSDAHDVQERLCEAGSYYVSRPGEHVSVRCTSACHALHVTVPVQLFWSGLESVQSCFSLPPACDVLLLQLARTLLEMHGNANSTHLANPVTELLVDRLRQLRAGIAPSAAASRKTTLPAWRIQRVNDHVKAHLSEHITLNDMAAAAGLSPMHFAAQFRHTTGFRPHHYLLLCRLERAKALMANIPLSMLDIALEVGFQTQSHFTTVFKRLTGKTPRQWRTETLSSQPM